MMRSCISVYIFAYMIHFGDVIFVDYGNPYNDKPLKVGELTLSITEQQSPIHTKVYFPQEPGLYPAVLFFPGLNGYVLSEFYENVLIRIASHGFFVFGLDYKFPAENLNQKEDSKQDLKKIFEAYSWLQSYMTNKTVATIAWNATGLMCHSAGCDATLKVIRMQPKMFASTVFLEPFSYDVLKKVDSSIPAFMYGTELSEVGLIKCCLPGTDYNKFYEIWSCPKVVMNVADFGHCDILDSLPWTACKDSHFCTITKNVTSIPQYHEFVQGTASSFFISSLQGRKDALKFITDRSLIPFTLLELKSDLNCTVG